MGFKKHKFTMKNIDLVKELYVQTLSKEQANGLLNMRYIQSSLELS